MASVDDIKASDSIPKLNETNYAAWKLRITARLRKKNLYGLVSATRPRPSPSPATAEGSVRAAALEKIEAWDKDQESAAGEIALALDDSQLVHIDGIDGDPVAMWTKLETIHAQKKPGSRLNALAELISAKKTPAESLQAFQSRVNAARQRLKTLRPSTFTIEEFEDELEIMASIRGLTSDYEILKGNLMYTGKITLAELRDAFVAKDLESDDPSQAVLMAKHEPSHSKFCLYHQSATHSTEECDAVKKLGTERKAARKDFKKKPPQSAESANYALNTVSVPSHATFDQRAHTWVIDSGATTSMTPHRHYFVEYRPKKIPVRVAEGTVVYSAGVGSVIFTPTNGSPFHLHNVLHVPDIERNLFSHFSFVQQQGVQYTGSSDTLSYIRNGRTILSGFVKSNLGYLHGSALPTSTLTPHRAYVAESTWHRRLGHISKDKLKLLASTNLTNGLNITHDDTTNTLCEPCVLGKHHRDPFPTSKSRATQRLALVHTDVHELPVVTPGGCKYWVTFVDDYSRFAWFYPIKHKSDVFSTFKRWLHLVENQTQCKVKIVRDDKGGEYESNAFKQLYSDQGIERHRTATATPQQNGVAERLNRTTEERLIAMLQDARLPHRFWGEALQTYSVLHNICPTKAVPDSTPYERYYLRKPNVIHLRTFGCKAYVHVLKAKRKHLDPHSRLCIFLGYEIGMKAWRFYDPQTRTVFASRDAIFLEEDFPAHAYFPLAESEPRITPPQSVIVYQQDESENHHSNHHHHPILPDENNDSDDESTKSDSTINARETSVESSVPSLNLPRRSARLASIQSSQSSSRDPTPASVEDDSSEDEMYFDGTQQANLVASDEPITYQAAMKLPDADQWHDAAVDEYNAHLANGTWEIVDLPHGRKTVGSRWVFKRKLNADSTLERYKARIVAKGYSQVGGVDFDELFAPVAKWESMRTMLAIAAIEDWEIHQIDFTTAFLNGRLEEEIYIKQPEGFHQGDKSKVCLLKKAIPGLRQASRAWYRELHSALTTIGFKRLESDTSIYTIHRNGAQQVLSVYVDDEIMAGSDSAGLEWTKQQLGKYFKFKDHGPVKFILGVEVHRNRQTRELFLSQRKHVTEILERFQMQDCRPVSTPLEKNGLSKSSCPKNDIERERMKDIPYINVVGALNYLAICTRPDISYAVGALGQYNSNPGWDHWVQAKRVLRYLKHTQNLMLRFGPSASSKSSHVHLHGYSDADYGGDDQTRKSTSAYTFFIADSLVSWRSKRQPVVALSTTEAEYIAAVSAGQEGMSLRTLLKELGYTQSHPTPLLLDNQSAIRVARNPEHQSRIKHMDIRYHWFRNVVQDKIFAVDYIETQNMAADILTKPLTKQAHERGLKLLGLRDSPI